MGTNRSWNRAAMALVVGVSGACALADTHVPLALPSGPGEPLPPMLGEPAATLYHPANVLVRFKADTSRDAIAQAAGRAGVLEYVHTYHIVPGLYCVRVTIGEVEKAIASLKADPAVMYAEPDYWRFAMSQTTPYGINQVGAPAVWAASAASGHKGAGARVAVLDTGVDLTHEDLPVPVLFESFINGQTVDDFHDHGTHCSGTVLALDNNLGVIGVAPECSLMIGKVLSNGGSGATSGVMAGAQWASDNGANVISMSLGGGGESQAESDVYAACVANNVLVVAAAGNDNSITPSFPGSYPSVMCVAAIDENFNRASFSNFGPTIDISGPGVAVLSTIPDTTRVPQATWNGVPHNGAYLTGSPTGDFAGQAIYCSVGNPADFPPSVAGQIAHIRRAGTSTATGSTLSFREKTDNAIAAGAIGVIISNNAGGVFAGTLNGGSAVPVMAISQGDGDELQSISGVAVSVAQGLITRSNPYAFFNGTSMATPHVAGVAGLLFGYFGPANLTVTQLRTALESTAQDLGDPGRDDLFGYGLVRADLARAFLDSVITPPCPGDFNHDGSLNPDDLGDFINCYFSPGCPEADFNADGSTNPDDLGDFINIYFQGC